MPCVKRRDSHDCQKAIEACRFDLRQWANRSLLSGQAEQQMVPHQAFDLHGLLYSADVN
jgi:hypothetical protein